MNANKISDLTKTMPLLILVRNLPEDVIDIANDDDGNDNEADGDEVE